MVTNHKDAISLEESNTNSKLDTLHSTHYILHHNNNREALTSRLLFPCLIASTAPLFQ